MADIRLDHEKLPWLCAQCAHFIAREADEANPPSHECGVAGRVVVFDPYTSSEQAEHIRRRIPAPDSRKW